LLEGLRRLEYRGYDSWGVCLAPEWSGGKGNGHGADGRPGLLVRKDAGRLTGVATEEPAGRFWGGIAHTRWATHGAPTRANAHPHLSGDGTIAVIHNGIIENHAALRERLEAAGHVFASETDSEVVPHLIEEFVKQGQGFTHAFLGACRLLEGTYGLAAVSASQPGVVLCARRGSPIVLGLGEHETLVASDPTALVSFTRNVVYLEDGEAALLRAEGIETIDLDAVPVPKEVERIAFDLPAIERGGHAHFMLKEIHEQPETIHDAFRGRLKRGEGTAKLGGIDEKLLRGARRCHILACGTSWHAGLIGKHLIENLARVPTEVSYAAEFRYSNPVVEPDTLFIAVSQSGETADTLAAIRESKLRGGKAIGICNVVGSTLARECGQGVYIHAGPEIGVASTKAFTSQLIVLSLLAIHMGRMRGMSLSDAIYYLNALEQLPDLARRTLKTSDEVRSIAASHQDRPNFLYVGRLCEYPVALEGALKLKEISYVHAEGIQAAELKHGPIALVDPQMPTVVVAAAQAVLDKMLSNIQEIKARGGEIIAVAAEGDERVSALADRTIFVPRTLDLLSPVLSVIPLQLLAYHMAVARGCDVDRPRNLAKSVTVE
jgi:glucosamine--fructose-6-phosphate aminotransferase (isomerizing)